ncbi:MAG TPA: hypothetical protein VFV38_14850 [Ktedonobacteraceae bacterium]|nr:hypothetical protein [Ktedonobacteraceae bacterium]
MNTRGIGLALLILCILGGLVAAFFSPVLAATLTLPPSSNTGAATTPATSTHAPVSPGVSGPFSESTPLPTQLPSGVFVLARDTFQRPDQALWGKSSDGQIWGGDANTSQAFAIARHAGQISGGQGAMQATLNVAGADADLLLSGAVNRFAANGTINLGVILRWSDPNNWYKVLIDGKNLQLLKDVHGQISVLAVQPFKATVGVVYTIRFRALGSDLFAKVWPATRPEPTNWALMVIDTSLTGGMSGIRVLLAPGAVIRVTSFVEMSLPNTV